MGAPEDRDAAFVAKITANATHELRNVLAIVKESAGLVTDVIHSLGGRALSNPDKVVRAIGRIDAQVNRGAAFLANLNRFAHSLDRAREEIDLNQEAQQTAFLCQRLARRGRHEIRVQSGDQALPVGVNSLWLQMALFAAVECCLDQLPEAGTVTIRTARQGDRPSLEFVAEAGQEAVAPFATGTASWGQLLQLLDRLGASIEASNTERRFLIVLPLAEVA
jgi:C4-dicarboxylate-specific signal transduction histidine kinase